MSKRDLRRLFERFRTHGSTAALARLFDRTAPALLRVARRIAGNAADAEDAVQSTFLAAIECAGAWDARRPVEPWLFGILVRQLGLIRRREARVLDATSLEPARAEDPAVRAQDAELVASVEAALHLLPERDREVLLPWLADEARGVELAGRLGVAGSTMRMRLRRGLVRLRRALPAGLATGIVLSAADRRALAEVRANVVAAAARTNATIAAGTAAAAAGAATSSIATSILWKLGLAASVAAAAIGAVGLFASQRAPVPSVPASASTSDPAASTSVAATGVAAARVVEPAAAGAELGAIRSDSVVVTTVVSGAAGSAVFAGLEGNVVTSEGAPLAGARIQVFDDDHPGIEVGRAMSGDDGTFRIPMSGVWALHAVAEKEGFARTTQQGTPFGHPFTVTMSAGATLEGTIADEMGTPAPFASVELADATTRFAGPIAATADADGRYRIEHVAGLVRWVRATSADRSLVGCSACDLRGRTAAPADVVLRSPSSLTLTITARRDGRPIEGALALLCAGNAGRDTDGSGRPGDLFPWTASARSDAEGRVLFASFAALEPVTIAVAAPGRAPIRRTLDDIKAGVPRGAGVPREPGVALVESIELEEGCAVEGVALGIDGAPIAGERVGVEGGGLFGDGSTPAGTLAELRALVLEEGAGNPFALETTTGVDGSFRLADLPPMSDRCLCLQTRHGYAYAWLRELRPGERQTGVTITRDAKVRIEGKVVAEDGAAPAGTQIWIHPVSDVARPDADGRFALELLPRGRATLWVVAPGYLHARCDVEPPLPGVSWVAITLERGRSVEGTIVDAQRRAVAGAQVIAWPADPTEEERERRGGWITEVNLASTTSGSDGRFVLRGLPERPLRLAVHAGGFGEASIEPVAPGSDSVLVELASAR